MVPPGVTQTGTGGHSLHLICPNQYFVAHGIPMGHLPLQDHGDDFHLGMGMFPKPLSRLNNIIIEDPQGAVPHILRIVLVAE